MLYIRKKQEKTFSHVRIFRDAFRPSLWSSNQSVSILSLVSFKTYSKTSTVRPVASWKALSRIDISRARSDNFDSTTRPRTGMPWPGFTFYNLQVVDDLDVFWYVE